MSHMTLKPGIYLRGIRITEPQHHVTVKGGLYICPFATAAIRVSANVENMSLDGGFRALVWGRWFWKFVGPASKAMRGE